MPRPLAIVAVLFAALAAAACSTSPMERRDALIATERAFAALANEAGIRDAFLRHLSEDSVVFRPGPVAARESYESRPPIPGVLRWAPAHAEISGDGDLGYTTGPWTYRAEDDASGPSAFGEFVSVWRARDDGSFELVADIGIDHEGPVTFPEEVTRATSRDDRRAGPSAAADLVQAERDLLEAASSSLTDAVLDRAADDVRVYRNGARPAVGAERAGVLLRSTEGSFEGTRLGGGVASSADLAWSYGTGQLVRSSGSGRGPHSFLRIWRRERGGMWRVVVDVLVPTPTE